MSHILKNTYLSRRSLFFQLQSGFDEYLDHCTSYTSWLEQSKAYFNLRDGLFRVSRNIVFNFGKIQIINYWEKLHLPWRRFLLLTRVCYQPAVCDFFLPGSCDRLNSATSVFLPDLPVSVMLSPPPYGLELVTLWVDLVCIWIDILALSEEMNAQPQEIIFCSMSRRCKTHQFSAVKVLFALPLSFFFYMFFWKHPSGLDVCLYLPDFVLSPFGQKYTTANPIC